MAENDPMTTAAVKQKANEMAVDALKQVLTLASAILALTITFIKDLLGGVHDAPKWTWMVPVAWGLLVLVIWTAWVAIADACKTLGQSGTGYVFGQGRPVVLARIAQWSFLGALVMLALFAIRNFPLLFTKTP